MAFSDARNERDRAETGKNSNNHGGGGGIGSLGGRGTLGQQQDRKNMETARKAGNAAPGVSAHGDRGTLSQQQDRINMNRALARSNTAPGVGNYNDAMNDFNNVDQGFFDDPLGTIARWLGGSFGVGEIDPRTQAPKSFIGRNTASWGIDPIGAALGLGGLGLLGTGAPGSIYNMGKSLAGVQGPMIAFDGNHPLGSSVSSSGIAGLNRDSQNRDNQNRGFGTSGSAERSTGRNVDKTGSNTNKVDTESEYPIGGKVNPYLGDIAKYGFGPMWDWLLYPGQPGYNNLANGGYPRQPQGQVNGPGGPKDDLVGPIALSNKEYVLPVEMIQHFGQGDYNKGIDALELIRKKVIK